MKQTTKTSRTARYLEKIFRELNKDSFETAVNFMDEEIRERLLMELAPCTEEEFLTAYKKAHKEKYGVEWLSSKDTPWENEAE